MEQGYDDRRFQTTVDANFHCPICLNVLKDPVQCRRNEHYFCTPCITRHITQTSQCCPVCTEPLSLKTLKEPSRIVVNYLATLKLKCDYAKQGCSAVVPLSDIKLHVQTCDYQLVPCSIEGCRALVCRRDKQHHETQVCAYRRVKCSACHKRVFCQKYSTHGCVLKQGMTELREEVVALKEQVETLTEIAKRSNEKQSVQQKTIKELNGIISELKQDAGSQPSTSGTQWDLLVLGGHDGSSFLDTVEAYNCTQKSWASLATMKQPRLAPSVLLYQGNLIVTGGFAGGESTDSMERMDVRKDTKEWLEFRAKLPFNANRHVCVLYQNRVFVIGGEDGGRSEISDGIYEILLTSAFTTRLVVRMPQPRVGHSAGLYKDKIVIVGGKTTNRATENTDSVLIFDIPTEKVKEVSPLPFAVSQMAVACHKDSLMIIGGQNKQGEVLNSFFAYNIKTGLSRTLPGMMAKREAPTAVVIGSEVIVMGGRNEKKKYLKTVESFSLEKQVWEALPSMKTARMHAASLAN